MSNRRLNIRSAQAHAPAPVADQRLPMTVPYQGMVLKIMLDDREFSTGLAEYVRPSYFSNPVHQWAWGTAQQYRNRYGGFPTLGFLANLAAQLGAEHRDVYCAAIAMVRDQPVTDEGPLRDGVLEFVRLNVFREAWVNSRDLFNTGAHAKAMDLMAEAMDRLRTLTWRGNERTWTADGFVERHVQRQSLQNLTSAICSGIPELDKVFDGGLRPGEMAIWISYPKKGKTTLLINLSLVPTRTQFKKGIYFVLEGNRAYVENRFDTLLADENYVSLKRGEVDPQKWQQAVAEVQFIKGLHVIKDLTRMADAGGDAQSNALNITLVRSELRELHQRYGFRPDLVVLDYVDLMRSRQKLEGENAIQKQAVWDLKNLSSDGYAVWTASQVQRPKGDDWRDSQEVLLSNKVADCYDKVRIADFVGSLNQTDQEAEQGVARLYAELYRDGPANRLIPIRSDFSKMLMTAAVGNAPPGSNGAVIRSPDLGYGRLDQLKQRKI